MRWKSNWAVWGLLAFAVTLFAAFQSTTPAERWLVDLFRGMPPDGLWAFLNGIVKTQWLYGALVMASALIVYVLCPTREAAIPLAGLMGGLIIDWMLTPLVGRPRPLPGASGASFPSGGAIIWTTWLGSLIVILWRRMRSGIVRKVAIGTLLLLIVLGGMARLAIAAHWFTDVAGAWLWGTTWVLWLHSATKQVG